MGELRIRNVPKELTDKFKRVEQHFKTVESTKAIEQLIRQFFEDQETIKRMENENRSLLNVINAYRANEGRVKDIIQGTINNQRHAANYGKNIISAAESLLKQLSKNRTKKKPVAKKKRGTNSKKKK